MPQILSTWFVHSLQSLLGGIRFNESKNKLQYEAIFVTPPQNYLDIFMTKVQIFLKMFQILTPGG